MRMHSKLRIPINRDLGFRIPIADAQPLGVSIGLQHVQW